VSDGTNVVGNDQPSNEELLARRVELLQQALAREGKRLRAAEQRLRELGLPAPDPDPDAADSDVIDPDAPALNPQTRATTPPPPRRPPAVAQAPTTWRAKVRSRAAAKLPPGSRRREVAKAALLTYREGVEFGRRMRTHWRHQAQLGGVGSARPPRYPAWLAGHRATPTQLSAQAAWASELAAAARVHVVVRSGTGDLDRTLTSLREQSWPHWTASAPRGGGPADARIALLSATTDRAIDEAVSAADAEFVVVCDAGDVLAPDCLFSIGSTHYRDPLADLITWDDDVIDATGSHADPQFRPAWSPEMLLGADYIGTAFALRRSLWIDAAGLAEAVGGSTWSLILRCDLPSARVVNVSRVLSSVTGRRPVPESLGTDVVSDILRRRDLSATVEPGRTARIRWRLPEPPKVTVVIPTRHNRSMLATCLPSLARTDYPAFEVVIVDNGGRTTSNEQWYADNSYGLDLRITWWETTPFNYSAVNNAGARVGTGDVLVFLNDDTELLDPSWMRELVGWAQRPEIGVVGLQLIGPDDKIQHAGAVVGLGGFADHIFEGMRPGSDSMFGRTDWYRNGLAVTGACMAVRRQVFDEIGGLDERFQLCGSDVAFGLDSVLRGYRNLCSPFGTVRHLEGATRGANVPRWDFFMSYWRYNAWLFGGDPYYSPNLSLGSRVPQLRAAGEPTPQERVSGPLGRTFSVFRQRSDAAESRQLADMARAMPIDVQAVRALHLNNAEPFEVKTINWFVPEIDSPFYGGINTALRIADELARTHGVKNRFIVWGQDNEYFARSALAAAFPALGDSEVVFYAEPSQEELETMPYADISIATLWLTAYAVAHFPNTRRKFYLIQDFEPMFYPAGTLYALTEETYKLGLYGICNTPNLLDIYSRDYGGQGMAFMPAVDRSVFNAEGRHDPSLNDPVTVFVYGRPGHWRNCWELAALALEELKRRLGDRVRIVTAGAWAEGSGADMEVKRLGLLDYRATGQLYRQCDVGLALTVSKHPSYLPLELMACGVPVVAFDNPWGHWILRDDENSLLSKRTVDSLADRLERLCTDRELRQRLAKQALHAVEQNHADWSAALSGIYGYLCDPEGDARR
jgi:O-antigen biosynthesis protein